MSDETWDESVVPPESAGSATVLVVDDDPQLRALLRLALEMEQFRVEEAASGAEALEFLLEREPDLVLLDVLMPDFSGIETCRWIRAQSSVPIIMLTAVGHEQDIAAGLEAGADDYVTKPVSMVQLVARIRAQLRRRALDADVSGRRRGSPQGEVVLEPALQQVIVKGRAVDLSA